GTVIEKAQAMGSAIKNALSGGPSLGGWLNKGNPSNPIEGARATGGPVSYGKPYLVGERGPEVFVPGMAGNIAPNATPRRLTADGAAAVAGSPEYTTNKGGPVTIINNWTINGADDPRAVVRQIDSRFGELMRQLENQQSGLLSD